MKAALQRLTILEKFFYKETIRSCLFLLAIFYSLYVLIDLMTHIREFGDKRILLKTWIEYYLCVFSRRIDILLPFAVLISTIRILLMLQSRNELVALLASGISIRKIINPMLVVSFMAAALLYANYQFVIPYALPRTIFIQQMEFGKEEPKDTNPHIHEIVLEDTSRIVYQSYDPLEKQFHDVFWIRSPDEIYHIKTLSPEAKAPIGKYVDKLLRNKEGFLEKKESSEIAKMESMQFNEASLKNSITPANEQSLTQLQRQQTLYKHSYSDRAIEIRSNYFYKLMFPLLAILAFIGPAPYCLEFRKQLPVFMVYLLSLASLLCFFLLLQATFILAKANIIPSWAAIGAPWAIVFYIFGKRYATFLK